VLCLTDEEVSEGDKSGASRPGKCTSRLLAKIFGFGRTSRCPSHKPDKISHLASPKIFM